MPLSFEMACWQFFDLGVSDLPNGDNFDEVHNLTEKDRAELTPELERELGQTIEVASKAVSEPPYEAASQVHETLDSELPPEPGALVESDEQHPQEYVAPEATPVPSEQVEANEQRTSDDATFNNRGSDEIVSPA